MAGVTPTDGFHILKRPLLKCVIRVPARFSIKGQSNSRTEISVIEIPDIVKPMKRKKNGAGAALAIEINQRLCCEVDNKSYLCRLAKPLPGASLYLHY